MVDIEIRELFEKELPGVRVSFGEPMEAHTSLRIGGPAEVFITPHDASTLTRVMELLRRAGFPVFALGGGTNLLVSDAGMDGAVVSLASLRGIETVDEGDDWIVLKAGAGVPLQELVARSKKAGLSGLEGLAGIPGQVGGAIAGNAGSYGVEMKDSLLQVLLIDESGDMKTIDRDDIAFGYRRAGLPQGSVVLAAEVKLLRDSPQAVAGRVEHWVGLKRITQPLGSRSAGCVFKNPPGESAGKLIERASCKGMRIGGIEVSDVHANFFINAGGGSAGDFLRLMETVAGRVKEAFGIILEPEIRIVGRR